MNRTEKELWSNLDEAVFGTNDPDILKNKLLAMKAQQEKERSSLGRFLESLRHREDFTHKEMADKVRVDLSLWKDWEMDFATPSQEELTSVIEVMKWSSPRQDLLWKLWGEVARFRLKRMTLRPGELLAARGGSSDGGVAWTAIGQENQDRVKKWGRSQGLDFPNDLASFFTSLETEEQRERWLDDVLGS